VIAGVFPANILFLGNKILEMRKTELGEYFGISTAGVWRLSRDGKKAVEKRGIGL
jgi:hypothetical protein